MAQAGQQRYQRTDPRTPADLKTPVRNRYFYGKLLDVFHLELEQEYFNSKRWLLNRLVTGPGTVCGLAVDLTDDKRSVIVKPGLAIDRCGREIIVTKPSEPIRLPEPPGYEHGPGQEYQMPRQGRSERHHYCPVEYAHVLLCYHECESDPAPALAEDCGTDVLCSAGSIREQYRVEVREGYAPERASNFPDVIESGRINYTALVDYVIRSCRALPDDCCLPLANVRLRDTGQGWEPEIDHSIRPIVYTNRLLYELILSLMKEDQDGENY
jgi:hypothetical protein